MLEFARSRRIEPGSNLPGEAGAAWMLALPDPTPSHVVCVGDPGEPALAALMAAGARVTAIVSPGQVAAVQRAARRASLDGIRVMAAPALDAADGSADVLWVDRDDEGLTRSARYWGWLTRNGVTIADSVAVGRGRPDASAGQSGRLRLIATPRHGPIRSIVDAADGTTRSYLARHGFIASPRVPMLRYVGRGVERRLDALVRARLRGLVERAVLMSAADLDGGSPPRYLLALADAAGIDLAAHRWAISATGRYPGQKALLPLFPPGADEPAIVVKVARVPFADPLIENEARTLRHLDNAARLDETRWPRVLFDGRAGRRSLVAETAVGGVRFADRSLRVAECPFAADAVAGLTALGETTAAGVPGAAAADALTEIVRRFAALYPASSAGAAWLMASIGAAAATPIHAVTLHGDPGPQNLLVAPGGSVAFADWENGERAGPPAWDLLHFARTYATWATRERRGGTRLHAASVHFIEATALTPFIESAIAAYRRRVPIPAIWMEPLFFANLAYRAVNESTRLPPEARSDGAAVRLFDRLFSARQAEPLKRLLAAGEPSSPPGEAGR